MTDALRFNSYPDFDWRNPDYGSVIAIRMERLRRLRAMPEDERAQMIRALKAWYRQNPADFISDWGMTFDPRLAERDLPTMIPFLLFPEQRRWIDFVIRKWRERRRGLSEKSRDWGLSYGAVALSCTLCLHYEGLQIGFGSRKAEYVDSSKDPKSLFWKARLFMDNVPEEFRGGWLLWRDATHMRMWFPETGSVMSGEAGDQIGRGDRTSIYFVDESAYLERPELVEHSLSQTTNCRIDMSSVNGMNNPFAKNRHEGKIEVFVCDWRDDPRKDDAWYARMLEEFDPVTVAQEIDRDYQASVTGIVIPQAWVLACIDAKKKLGIAASGQRSMSLDVADEGKDKNAACGRQGTEIDLLLEKTGKGSDLFETTEWAASLADQNDYERIRYDSDGIGATMRGDARVINEQRRANGLKPIRFEGYRGSEGVYDPDGIVEGTMGPEGRGRTNQDYFANRKAQSWWSMRRRCQQTYRAVVEKRKYNPDEILSIDKDKVPIWHKFCTQMSQATYKTNGAGKIVIDKAPDGMPSPDLADAAVIEFAPSEPPPMVVTAEAINTLMRAGLGRRRR